jgi:ketosteroid isomerase-like protein
LSYLDGRIGDMDADAERAATPEDLSRLVVARLNAGDVEGLVALYESDAVLALPDGGVANGSEQIRRTFRRLLEGRPSFKPGSHRPTLRAGRLALTSTRLPDGTVTVEVARRQDDGTWLWAIDQPAFLPPDT